MTGFEETFVSIATSLSVRGGSLLLHDHWLPQHSYESQNKFPPYCQREADDTLRVQLGQAVNGLGDDEALWAGARGL